MASRPSEPAVVCLRGGASSAELAAVTAVLAALTRREPDISRYERWRRARLAATSRQLRRTAQ